MDHLEEVSNKLECLRLTGIFSAAVKFIGPGMREPENHNVINVYVTGELSPQEKAAIEKEAEGVRLSYLKLRPQ